MPFLKEIVSESLKVSASKKFDEIEQNFEYKTIKEQNYTPRVLKRGINEIFKSFIKVFENLIKFPRNGN